MQWKEHTVEEKPWTGVNARNFDPGDLSKVRIRLLDSAATWKYVD
jgi:hypothetical protein